MGSAKRPERTVPGLERFDFVAFGGGSRLMQCPSCRAVYSNGLDLCPRCSTPTINRQSDSEKSAPKSRKKERILMVDEGTGCETPQKKSTSAPSTLLEFPGAGRAAQPVWRKELSERVRQIQERRAREAEREAHERRAQRHAQVVDEAGGMPLGLVPQPDQPPLNPLVAAALKRIERAQQNPQRNHTRAATRGASVAVARVAEEQFEAESEVETRPSPVPVQDSQREKATSERRAEARRPHVLSVVQPSLIAEATVADVTSRVAEKMFQPISASTFEVEETETLAPGEFYDDYAPFSSRFVAGVIDLLVVAFASSPFAAIIELTNGDWTDERVVASMGGIFGIIMFLYLTTSTTIGGRTWGMSLLSLRAVDVDSGLPPTTKQSVTRAFVYMFSLATVGLGILYALVDAEHRGVHDHLSGTTVVRE
jgi:uncharacterized RDD family membrane protein YckC